jgi:hypothetical protein
MTDLEEQAKRYEEAVKRMGKTNIKTRVDLIHNVTERNFDDKTSKIEEQIEEEIKEDKKLFEFNRVNSFFNKIFRR